MLKMYFIVFVAWGTLHATKVGLAASPPVQTAQWVVLVSPWEGLRDKPRASAKQVVVVYGNEVFKRLSTRRDWQLVERTNGLRGWLPRGSLLPHYPNPPTKEVEANNPDVKRAFLPAQSPNTTPNFGARFYRSNEALPIKVRQRLLQNAIIRWFGASLTMLDKQMDTLVFDMVEALENPLAEASSNKRPVEAYNLRGLMRRPPIGMTRRGLKNRGISQQASKGKASTPYEKLLQEAQYREEINDKDTAEQAYADLILLNPSSDYRYRAIYALNKHQKLSKTLRAPPTKAGEVTQQDYQAALDIEARLLQGVGDRLHAKNKLGDAKNLYESAVMIGRVFRSQLKVLTNLTNQKRKGITPGFIAHLHEIALNTAANGTQRLAILKNFVQSSQTIAQIPTLTRLLRTALKKSISTLERAEHLKRVRRVTIAAPNPLTLLQEHQYAAQISLQNLNEFWRVEQEIITTMQGLKPRVASLSPKAQAIVRQFVK